jgi:hypothetical protein
MNVPQYNGGSVTKYFKSVEQYELNLLKDKYNIILDFINEWLNYPEKFKLKSLIGFKNIKEGILLKDLKHNRDILRKFSSNIIKKLEITFNIDDDTDSDEIKDRYILYFIQRCLASIKFSLTVRKVDDINYYTIKNKN